ncbi:hypothetical protein [Stenotrophomonas sp. YIM B06876]|uniref:hypothetical protein n=1 Tax=Stenotrophomonas sp. YIM B06876 TaxID=3060211 RepID=UPI00273855B9|nr:hypothetical protein [Stenotrophomonas sp. YIM B06876]
MSSPIRNAVPPLNHAQMCAAKAAPVLGMGHRGSGEAVRRLSRAAAPVQPCTSGAFEPFFCQANGHD